MAVPKGRILEELMPIMERCGIVPEPAFTDKKSRLLRFETNIPNLDLIRVRSFDAATFVAFGAAHMGVVGKDVLDEFDFSEIYSPLDLGIGGCRLSLAARVDDPISLDDQNLSHVRVASKYPSLTRKYFARRGVQAEIIKLNGAMELAPAVDLSPYIVDLVSTGNTMKANGLEERGTMLDVTSRFVVNRTAMKTMPEEIKNWIERFREAVS